MKRIPARLFQSVLRLVQPHHLKNGGQYALPPACPHAAGKHTATDHSAPGLTPAIPKIIWTYWNQPQPDAFVHECMQSWRLHCPDYEIRLVQPGNLQDYTGPDPLPPQFAELAPAKQADWVRLYMVARYGGFWLDASTLLTTSLDWMHPGSEQGMAFTGFYLEKFTRDADFPVIESWAFGAPAGGAFITAWQKEFHQALIVEGTTAYLQRLQALPGWTDLQQGITDPQYLLIHITAQQVLRRDGHFRMALYKAEDTAYYYHRSLRWKWYLLYPQLCLAAAPGAIAPLVKLRGGERRHFSEMLAQHGGAKPGSLWHQAMNPDRVAAATP